LLERGLRHGRSPYSEIYESGRTGIRKPIKRGPRPVVWWEMRASS
jgi:hypothetical protein